jgi:HNH endonuclease
MNKSVKPKSLPAQGVLLNWFRYEPYTGKLFWRIKPSRRHEAGMEAGWADRNGALMVNFDYSHYYIHRIIWKMLHNEEPPMIDHKDGQPWNNREDNLRAANDNLNQRNRKLLKRPKSVAFKGVYKPRNRNFWIAQIKKNGVHHYLGSFASAEEAHAAYLIKARELFGEFANDGHGPCL